MAGRTNASMNRSRGFGCRNCHPESAQLGGAHRLRCIRECIRAATSNECPCDEAGRARQSRSAARLFARMVQCTNHGRRYTNCETKAVSIQVIGGRFIGWPTPPSPSSNRLVALDSCCGAHHLGRLLRQQNHQVRLMSPEYLRPYGKSQVNDDRDAEAMAEAALTHHLSEAKWPHPRRAPDLLLGACANAFPPRHGASSTRSERQSRSASWQLLESPATSPYSGRGRGAKSYRT